MSEAAHVELVMDWDKLGEAQNLRRDTAGFSAIKTLAAAASPERPLRLNAFLYAFLCPAKNFDLFLREHVDGISEPVRAIAARMADLEGFEREAAAIDPALREVYLGLRHVAARANARDEQRTMAVLLFSGPSSAETIAQDLGISANLAARSCLALEAVITEPEPGLFAIRADLDALAAVLYLVRSTLGLDPIAVLTRRIQAAERRSRR